MIWRRVLVPASTILRELHGILQVAMGWEGVHLFLFDIYAVTVASDGDDVTVVEKAIQDRGCDERITGHRHRPALRQRGLSSLSIALSS